MECIGNKVKILDTEYARNMEVVDQIGITAEKPNKDAEFDLFVKFDNGKSDYFNKNEVESLNEETKGEQTMNNFEKIDFLMDLVKELCEKDGYSLFTELKGDDGFIANYYSGDRLLNEVTILNQLQRYEVRYGRKLIDNGSEENKNYTINVSVENSKENSEKLAKTIIDGIKRLNAKI
jgi:hypothetical protein